jgi:phospholipase C
MKTTASVLWLLGFCGAMLAHAQITSFTHVIVIVQENRKLRNFYVEPSVSPIAFSGASKFDHTNQGWPDIP